MMLCLRVPWFNELRPYMAVWFGRWGAKYAHYTRQPITVYRAGIGIGRVTARDYAINRHNVTWHPEGSWKFRYWERAQ